MSKKDSPKTFHDFFEESVAECMRAIQRVKSILKSRKLPKLARQNYEKSLRRHERRLEKLEARRKRYEEYQANKKIPARLRKQIAWHETINLIYEPSGTCPREKKQLLLESIEQANRYINPPKKMTTTNKTFEVDGSYPGQLITRTYDGHVWDVLKSHFEKLFRKKGQRASFKIVAPLPEKSEYLQLKDLHYTRTLEWLVEDAYGIVEELRTELEDAYESTPEGLKSSAVGEARLDAANELESIFIGQPDIPKSISSLLLLRYPSLHQKSRGDRAGEAAAILRAISQAIGQHRKSQPKLKRVDANELDEFCEQLEDDANEIENVGFPGMHG